MFARKMLQGSVCDSIGDPGAFVPIMQQHLGMYRTNIVVACRQGSYLFCMSSRPARLLLLKMLLRVIRGVLLIVFGIEGFEFMS